MDVGSPPRSFQERRPGKGNSLHEGSAGGNGSRPYSGGGGSFSTLCPETTWGTTSVNLTPGAFTPGASSLEPLMAEIRTQILPSSRESENAVLGSVLLDESIYLDLRNRLTSEDFYTE